MMNKYSYILVTTWLVLAFLLFPVTSIEAAVAVPSKEERGATGCDAVLRVDERIGLRRKKKYKRRYALKIATYNVWYHKPYRTPYFLVKGVDDSLFWIAYDYDDYLWGYKYNTRRLSYKFYRKYNKSRRFTSYILKSKHRVWRHRHSNQYAIVYTTVQQQAGFVPKIIWYKVENHGLFKNQRYKRYSSCESPYGADDLGNFDTAGVYKLGTQDPPK